MATLTFSVAFGDSWAGATPAGAVSPDASLVIRIVPGNSIGETVGFSGAPKGRHAQATYFKREGSKNQYQPYLEITLQNPIAPVEALLSNAGVLVTLDNWHNMGYGMVVVIFDSGGNILSNYALEDLYTKKDLFKISQSVSSRWWRCNVINPRLYGDSLRIIDAIGGEFTFNLKDGTFSYEKSSTECPN